MKTRASLKFFVNDCVWKYFFCFQLPPGPFKFTFCDDFGHPKSFHTALTKKLEQLTCKKVLKFHLFPNCFSDFFTEVKIWY